jgi:hypothetical protein
MAPIITPNEPRCPTCSAMLIHAGSICVICDAEAHYEAPIRTSPPLLDPKKRGTDREDVREAV